MREKMMTLWGELLNMNKVRPYVFRTRLNRVILKTKRYGYETNNVLLQDMCSELEHKMSLISDQSNQTSDGKLGRLF